MDCSMPGFPVFHYLPESAHIVMPSNHPIFRRPLFLFPSVFLSIRVFSNESAPHIKWPKYWSFSISPSKEYSELISFRVDWFDFLSVQGTLKSLLQHHQFFSTQPSLWFNSHIHTSGCIYVLKVSLCLKFTL